MTIGNPVKTVLIVTLLKLSESANFKTILINFHQKPGSISRYSDFLSAVLINTGIFLRGLKQCGESRT